MKINFYPKEKLGKMSLLCFLLAILLLIIFFGLITIFDFRGGDTFFSTPELTIPMVIAWMAGVFAFVFGVMSLIKAKTRSILVMVIMILSFLTTLYGVIEIASPH